MWFLLAAACTAPDTSTETDAPDAPVGDDRDEVGGVDTPSPFDEAFQHVELVLPETSIAGLATTHDADPPEVPAEWRVDGKTHAVGVKLRGGSRSFRTLDGKPSFTLDFAAFTDGATYKGVRRLDLSSLVQDASLAGESLAYAFHAATGGHAPRHVHARLRVNGQDYGVYGLVEVVDEDFVEARFDDDGGPLYAAEGDLYRGHVSEFRLDEGEDDGHALLLNLVGDLDRATGTTRMRVLERHFDVDALLTTLAVDVLTGNPDAYVTRANNYALYHSPDEGRWTLLPTGAEQAFVAALPVDASYIGRLRADCLDSPTCAERLRTATLAALEEWESLTATARATIELLAPECATEPRAEIDCAEGADALLRFVDARAEDVRADLE